MDRHSGLTREGGQSRPKRCRPCHPAVTEGGAKRPFRAPPGGRLVLTMTLSLVLAAWVLALTTPVEARPRVAVLPFKTSGGFDYPLGDGMAQLLRKRLMESGKVQIVDREDLGSMKGELQLADDGYFDPSTFPAKGGFQGADYLVTGRVLDFGHYSRDTTLGALTSIAQIEGLQYKKTTAYVRLGIEVVDLSTGRLTLSEEAEGKHQKSGAILMAGDLKRIFIGGLKIGSSEFDSSMIGRATKQSMDKLIGRLTGIFTRDAKVLAVSPEGVVIDMGSASGLQVGRKGRVFSTREIKNAAGRVVWKSRRQVGEGEVIEVQPEDSLLRCPASAELKEGDVVVFE
ncbi:MAG: hypothetical protein GX442_15005 [Candidatus Riflebacteria bacterium]|nr:hypothetical protein [Candidatus Riflebacteria bacterium]